MEICTLTEARILDILNFEDRLVIILGAISNTQCFSRHILIR